MSKENGVLLFLFIAIFENIICINYLQIRPLSKKIKIILIKIPSFIFVGLLLYLFYSQQDYYEFRNFSMLERMLSEPRVVSEYLYHLFVPNYFTVGVYTDGFNKSTSLLDPLSTIFSIAFVLGLLIFAYKNTKTNPLISFSIFFYFIGHILESTFLPLELYYEHRNYLSSLFLFLPVSVLILNHMKNKFVIFSLIISIMILLSTTTYKRTILWGDELKLKVMTAIKFPNSQRATIEAASITMNFRDLKTTEKLLKTALNYHSTLYMTSNYISYLCSVNKLNKDAMDTFLHDVQVKKFSKDALVSFSFLVRRFMRGECMGDDSKVYTQKLINEFNKNKYGHRGLSLEAKYFFNAHQKYINGDISKSLDTYKKLFDSNNDYSFIISIALRFYKNKQNKEADLLYNYILEKFKNRKFYQIDWSGMKNKLDELNLMLNSDKTNLNKST
jgi:hypothetical protein